jgi:hypothetical protein
MLGLNSSSDPLLLYCEVCDIKVNDVNSFEQHLAGKKHCKRAKQAMDDEEGIH